MSKDADHLEGGRVQPESLAQLAALDSINEAFADTKGGGAKRNVILFDS